MSAVAVTPGAVAKIRESKIVTDELNVQVRSLVYVLLLSLRVSDSCRGDAFFLFSKNFSRFSLSLSLGISQQKFFGVSV